MNNTRGKSSYHCCDQCPPYVQGASAEIVGPRKKLYGLGTQITISDVFNVVLLQSVTRKSFDGVLP